MKYSAKHLPRGAVAGWYLQACTAASVLCVVPLINNRLGAEACGIWLGIQGVVLVASLADFGLGYITARQAAFIAGGGHSSSLSPDIRCEVNNWSKFRGFMDRIRLLNVVSIAVAALLLLALSTLFVSKVAHNDTSVGVIIQLGLILSASALLNLLSKPDLALLEGAGGFIVVRILLGTQALLTAVGLMIVLLTVPDLRLMALCVLFLSGIMPMEARRRARALLAGYAPSWRRTEPGPPLIALLSKACPLALVQAGAYIVSSLQVPLVAMFFNTQQVAPYFFAQRAMQFLGVGIMQILLSQLPSFSSDLGGGLYSNAAKRMRRSILLVSLLTVSAPLPLLMVLPIINQRLFPGQLLGPLVLLFLALEMIFSSITSSFGHFVLASGRNPLFRATIVSSLLNLPLVALFSQLGVAALPLSTFLSGVVAIYWVSIREGRQLYNQLRNFG